LKLWTEIDAVRIRVFINKLSDCQIYFGWHWSDDRTL